MVNQGQFRSIGVKWGQLWSIRVNWGWSGPWCFMFQIWALCDIRNTIKDTPIHHLLVGSLEDMVVPDAYCMDSWCPWGFLLQISAVCDIRNTIKDTPIHHLLVGSLEDMGVSSTPLNWSWEITTNCQAWLLLFSAQSSKFNSQRLNSEKKEQSWCYNPNAPKCWNDFLTFKNVKNFEHSL